MKIIGSVKVEKSKRLTYLAQLVVVLFLGWLAYAVGINHMPVKSVIPHIPCGRLHQECHALSLIECHALSLIRYCGNVPALLVPPLQKFFSPLLKVQERSAKDERCTSIVGGASLLLYLSLCFISLESY